MAYGWRGLSCLGLAYVGHGLAMNYSSRVHEPIIGAYLRKYRNNITSDPFEIRDEKKSAHYSEHLANTHGKHEHDMDKTLLCCHKSALLHCVMHAWCFLIAHEGGLDLKAYKLVDEDWIRKEHATKVEIVLLKITDKSFPSHMYFVLRRGVIEDRKQAGSLNRSPTVPNVLRRCTAETFGA